MLKHLEHKFHFNANFIYGNQEWGALKNGLWTGSVAMLMNQVGSLLIKTN